MVASLVIFSEARYLRRLLFRDDAYIQQSDVWRNFGWTKLAFIDIYMTDYVVVFTTSEELKI
jgi:hypothetical protein